MKTKRVLKTTLSILVIFLILSIISLISTAFFAIWEIYSKVILAKLAGSFALSLGIFGISIFALYHYIDDNY